MVAISLVATIVLATWAYLVVSYESPLGTDNVVVIDRLPSTNNTNDILATLSFEDGAENLDWASMLIEIEVAEQSYTCSFGSQSVDIDEDAKVISRLSSDGVTFSTTIDATSENTFAYFSIPIQGEGNQSNHTIRASKTDVFFSEGLSWTYLPGASFQDVVSVNESELSNSTADRLEWYTYDLSAHRITPNDGTYVLLQDGMFYKIQFVSYYNEKDESRHISILTAALIPEEHPALLDSSLVVPSPCLIETSGDTVQWNATESIALREQATNICEENCSMNINISYEMIAVKTENTE